MRVLKYWVINSKLKRNKNFYIILISTLAGGYCLITPINYVWYISLLLFIVGFIREVWALLDYRKYEFHPSKELSHAIEKINLGDVENESEYKIYRNQINVGEGIRTDSYLMSLDVNEYLLHNGENIKLQLDSKVPDFVKNKVNNNILFYSLAKQASICRKIKVKFINEEKVGLCTTLSKGVKNVEIYKTNYYHSFLLNDLSTKNIYENEECVNSSMDTFPIWVGKENCPVLRDQVKKECPPKDECIHLQHRDNSCPPINDNSFTMKTLEESRLSNHIGCNTLLITSDYKLIIWRQNGKSMRSQELLAPTGSGSMDFVDHTSEVHNLNSLVINGMERELREESKMPKGSNFSMSSMVVGYYRWINKAGLPGFLGITKTSLHSEEIKFDSTEVNKRDVSNYDANCKTNLKKTIKELLDSSELSTPLRANLIALSALIDDQKVSDFIWGD